jgi:hypothetical protein
MRRLLLRFAIAVALGACATAAAAAEPVPAPIGAGTEYQPGPGTHAVRGLRCLKGDVPRFGAHLELFANRLVVLVPPGIGTVPRAGCSYAARTREPTGVIEVARGSRLTIGDFFSIWGRPLSRRRLLGFQARPGERLLAFVGGRPWRRDPRSIPLTRHAEIVLQIRGHVRPHDHYLFPHGL